MLVTRPASSQALFYANQGDLASLDPHTLNESTTIAHLSHVYEGLVGRGKNLEIIPLLAESWENPEPTRWRFHLRRNVKFHSGDDFVADDVLFSADRVRAPGSNFQSSVPRDAKVIKVDDHTVDFILSSPDPILLSQFTWHIINKKWAEANDAVKPTPASATSSNYASLHANGTGPFRIDSHQPGVRTVFKANKGWWQRAEHNLSEIVFTPIKSDATRLAAFLSGEIDVIEPVPIQDIGRVNANRNVSVRTGSDLRIIFLGMDQQRDELLYSNVKGKNPFKDVRVREAVYRAIDVDLIKTRVMRDLSKPSALLIAPELFRFADQFARPEFDPDRAKKLLDEAGYPSGFEVGMDCPNDRYVNDEAICQAVVGMLARVGIKIDLLAQPKQKFFAKVLRSGNYNTSFYLLGWVPPTLDSHNVLFQVVGCRDGSRGQVNLGGYCNKRIDDITDNILIESDETKRDLLIRAAYELLIKDFAYIPLHQQPLAWGISDKIKNLTLRADNQVLFYRVTKTP
ncbi:ABC transporter substrate-binding protein [Bradyrhizobium ivorense]|uniref:ABC transporter substrate-binding protein n=1 Tax=Bradyrhizobium ivorense TaxID=2511166 RepID=UPI00111699AE|nr:ABC transporter substrate-binding protein [Bradyrhizobium ivorense]